jgi:exodeoxyribonuclease VII large subunit
VISAVGHEIDFTIADFVADLRAPTPSAAAELVCKNAAEITETITVLKQRLWRGWNHQLEMAKQSLLHASKRLVDPKRRLMDLMVRCDELSQRLEAGMTRYLERHAKQLQLLLSQLPSPREVILRLGQDINMLKTRLEAHWLRTLEGKRSEWARLSSVLDSLSPLKVVERGYSITFKDAKPVKSVTQIAKGDLLEITFAKGKAAARVEKILEE